MDKKHRNQFVFSEFFLVLFTIFLIVILFAATIMSINQLFIEKRNEQLENYKVGFKEVPKLLKLKVVFQGGSNTLTLPKEASSNKLTTVFINAPKGTKITFAAFPGAPEDTYERVNEPTQTLSLERKIKRIYFAGEDWTKNGVPISNTEIEKIILPPLVPVKVVAPKEFRVNIEKEINTVTASIAKEIRDINAISVEAVRIVTDRFDNNGRFVQTKEIPITDEDIDSNKVIKNIIEESDSNTLATDRNSNVSSTDNNTQSTSIFEVREHCCSQCIYLFNNSTLPKTPQMKCNNFFDSNSQVLGSASDTSTLGVNSSAMACNRFFSIYPMTILNCSAALNNSLITDTNTVTDANVNTDTNRIGADYNSYAPPVNNDTNADSTDGTGVIGDGNTTTYDTNNSSTYDYKPFCCNECISRFNLLTVKTTSDLIKKCANLFPTTDINSTSVLCGNYLQGLNLSILDCNSLSSGARINFNSFYTN
jgi:hypothetical protein